MRTIYLDWEELKVEILSKNFIINYRNIKKGYEVFVMDRSVMWTTNVTTASEKADFETNYKSLCNPSLYSLDGKSIVRSESRPLNHTTYFTCTGDSDTDIGNGSKLLWDFSNDNNEITLPSGSEVKTKRIEFKFLDSVYVKEGAIYFINAPLGATIDLKVICPNGNYYLDNDKNPVLATQDTVISHYVNNHYMCGDCPMGDELNTESCSDEIPSNYKFCLDITVPITNNNCTGHVSLELYRKRTVIL